MALQGQDHRQSRRLHVDLLVVGADLSLRHAAVGPVRHPGDLLRGRCGLHQHGAGRCLSGRRPAGGDLRGRAAGRGRRARAGHRSGRAAAQELHQELSAPDAGDHDLRRRRLSRPRSRRRWRSPTSRASARKRESARHGKLRGLGFSTYIEACGLAPSQAVGSLGCGVGLWESAEVRVNPTGSVEVLTGCSCPRPGPRDHVRAGGLRAARHPDRQRERRARRHRQGAVRHGHLRLALGRGRHVGARQGARQGRGQGQEGRGPHAGGGRRRHRVQGRQVHGRRHRQVGGLGRRHAQRLCRAQVLRPGAGAGAEGGRVLRSDQFHLPGRLPYLRGRGRSGDRRERDRGLDRGRRFRHGHQSDDRRGPGAWRHRAGRRPGAARRRGLRHGRPARDRLVHGLLHAARRQPAELQGGDHHDAEPVEPARHQGLRRGGRDRGAGRGDQCAHQRDRHRGLGDAGDVRKRCGRRCRRRARHSAAA